MALNLVKIKHALLLSCLLILFASVTNAQIHTFPTFSPGALTSGNSGITTTMSTGSLSGDYLTFTISADFVGSGNAQTAWSNSIQVELNNGSTTIFLEGRQADNGSMDNGNATTLNWSGILNKKFVGGTTLDVRFYDDYHDASGPYECTISNVHFTIYPANNVHTFPTYSPGVLDSGTSGITTNLSTSGISGNYLIYSISADFTGSGTAQTAWSNSIQAEISSGSTILKPLSFAQTGAMSNPNATTLTWTGVLNTEYVGGTALSTRFFDNYNDASGPYISNITNVVFDIYEAVLPTDYPVINPGTVTSGTSGVNTPLNTSGVTGDHLFYIVSADFTGSGTAQTAWSNSIQMELNNNAGLIFKPLSNAQIGAMDNPNATTLYWAGVMTEEYVGGNTFFVRFFDNYNDASGPYISNINNVQTRTYPAANASVPVELISFDAIKIHNNNNILIQWEATNEFGNAFYTIQKSNDSREWIDLTSILNHEDRGSENRYQFIDKLPFEGSNYYRLKQTDFDGSSSLSDIRVVQFSSLTTMVYPNPFKNIFTVEHHSENYKIELYNSLGRLIKTELSSSKIKEIQLNEFPAGIYMIVIDGSQKFTILKE